MTLNRKFRGLSEEFDTFFETKRRKERQRQDSKVARKAWKYRGRKTIITKKLIGEVQDLKENKKLSITQIMKVTGKDRNTINK